MASWRAIGEGYQLLCDISAVSDPVAICFECLIIGLVFGGSLVPLRSRITWRITFGGCVRISLSMEWHILAFALIFLFGLLSVSSAVSVLDVVTRWTILVARSEIPEQHHNLVRVDTPNVIRPPNQGKQTAISVWGWSVIPKVRVYVVFPL